MNTQLKGLFLLCSFFITLFVYAQNSSSPATKLDKKWVKMARSISPDFYYCVEAEEIAEQLLLYQTNVGGWPKNNYFPGKLSEIEKKKILESKANFSLATIDNDATTTEIDFLAKVYNVNPNEKYKKAVIKGINFILALQYENGGWPQFHLSKKGYYEDITYNDNAMYNVLSLLKSVYNQEYPYTFISKDIRQKSFDAFNKGIECILETQVMQEGELTVWCAQHDAVTLEPTHARSYELPSLSGGESADIVLLLMQIDSPSEKVKKSIESAVKWFDSYKIMNLERRYFVDSQGRKDYEMVKAEKMAPLWARFYDLKTKKPFFCSRDGIKKASVSDISYERRNGYGWYTNRGIRVLNEYKTWVNRVYSEEKRL